MLVKMKIAHGIAILVFFITALLNILMIGKTFTELHVAISMIIITILLLVGWYGYYLYFRAKGVFNKKERIKELKRELKDSKFLTPQGQCFDGD